MSISSFRLVMGLCLVTGVFGSATAQTRIGNVTLTSPTAPVQSAPAQSTSSSANIPSSWNQVRGTIMAPTAVVLPSGSRVNVIVEDITVAGRPKEMLRIQFGASRIPTPYNLYYNPAKYSSNRQYVVRATINDASGRELYYSSLTTFTTSTKVANINLKASR